MINKYDVKHNVEDQVALVDFVKKVQKNKEFFSVSKAFQDQEYRIVYRDGKLAFRVKTKKYGIGEYELEENGTIGNLI